MNDKGWGFVIGVVVVIITINEQPPFCFAKTCCSCGGGVGCVGVWRHKVCNVSPNSMRRAEEVFGGDCVFGGGGERRALEKG